jgi:hypothetical protein
MEQTRLHLSEDQLMVLTEESKKSDMRIKHAAGIYRGKHKLMGCGYNHMRTCIQGKPIYGLHAEVSAIIDVLKQMSLYKYLSLTDHYKWCFKCPL